MEQKVEFISAWRSQKHTITELCRTFEISRPTAYKMTNRFENFGINGLLERKKSPKNHPNKTSDKVEKIILDLKEKYPRWGAKKSGFYCLKTVLSKKYYRWLLFTIFS
jgi:transposase